METQAADAGTSDGEAGTLEEALRSLRATEAQLKSVIETVPDAFILINDEARIEAFSPAAERLFGYPAEEVLGRNIAILMSTADRGQPDDFVARYLQPGEKRIIGMGRVVTGKRADGSTFPMDLAIGEVKEEGRRRYTGFVRDLTERQTTRERLHELQSELLQASRLSAMGQMASALAHELNQPLTATLNYVQACRRMMAQDSASRERLGEIMDKAVAQAARAGHIIQRMRQFIQRGETDRQIEDINTVVEEASALALVGESGIMVHMELSAGLPRVLIDRVQIQQVILNLVRNSIEAMAATPRRELAIRTGRASELLVEVAVADTGPGLSEAVAQQLFQPFVTTKAKGMGLGLSISRTIIESHAGKLQARPNEGGGVIMHFILPIADAA